MNVARVGRVMRPARRAFRDDARERHWRQKSARERADATRARPSIERKVSDRFTARARASDARARRARAGGGEFVRASVPRASGRASRERNERAREAAHFVEGNSLDRTRASGRRADARARVETVRAIEGELWISLRTNLREYASWTSIERRSSMRTVRDYECGCERARALSSAVLRHADAGRGGAAREGAEPKDVTQQSGGP